MRSALTRSRRRKIAASVLGTLLVIVASAAAYYLIYGPGEGASTQSLGKGTAETLPLVVQFSPGLTPGGEEPIKFSAHDTTKQPGKVAELSWVATTSVPQCLPTWFAINGHGLNGAGSGSAELSEPVEIAVTEQREIVSATLKFTEESSVNQNACMNATVTITAKSSPEP